MADSKWIAGLSPDMPLVEAARIVLPTRFRTVLYYLPLAADSPAKDIERVHQFRVSTRRAGAALRLFAPCLPDKRRRRFRDSLRELRRAAGAARDWDVFFPLLQASPSLQTQVAKPALDFLRGMCAARRFDAQLQLNTIAAKAGEELRHDAKDLIDDSLEWKEPDQPHALGEVALHHVAALIRELDEATEPPPENYEELHRVRILGKRLRYSMEIFAACFAEPFREQLYPAIEEMQEILGRITDAHVAAERLVAMRDHMKAFHGGDWPRYRKPIDQFVQAQRRIYPKDRKGFLLWLPKWKRLTTEWPVTSLILK